MNACIPVVNGTDTELSNCTSASSMAVGATILSPVTMFLAGVLGNILALSRLYKRRTDARTTKFYNFITGLAWTDLLGILITTPSVLASYVNGLKWVGGDAHCRFHGFAMTCFGMATPLIICAMAVERFLALKCVFFYTTKCRSGTERGCILVIWLTVILFGVLPLYGFGSFEKQYPGTWCFLDFHSHQLSTKLYGFIYATTNMLLITIIILCNAYVVFTLFKTRLRRGKPRAGESAQASNYTTAECDGLVQTTQHHVRRRSNNVEIQMCVLLCALTVVFCICWAPLMIQILKTLATGKANLLMDLAAVRLASINQTLDPWLYILLRRSLCARVCKAVKQIRLQCIVISGYQPNTGHQQTAPDNGGNLVNNGNAGQNGIGDITVRPNIVPTEEINIRGGLLHQPDVMQLSKNSSSSPLPDVTNTGSNNKQNMDSGYVCHFHFGMAETADSEDGGIYVKIFYLRPESSFVTANPTRTIRTVRDGVVSPENCPEEHVDMESTTDSNQNHIDLPVPCNRACECSNRTCDMNTRQCDSSRPCSFVRRSLHNSNETFLSQDYNVTNQSETGTDVTKDINTHIHLRVPGTETTADIQNRHSLTPHGDK